MTAAFTSLDELSAALVDALDVRQREESALYAASRRAFEVSLAKGWHADQRRVVRAKRAAASTNPPTTWEDTLVADRAAARRLERSRRLADAGEAGVQRLQRLRRYVEGVAEAVLRDDGPSLRAQLGSAPGELTLPDFRMEGGLSLLALACIGGRDACAAVLLDAGAVADAADAAGMTPLMHACARGHVSCARLLLASAGSSVPHPAARDRVSLRAHARVEDPQAHALVPAGAQDGRTAAHLAARCGSWEALSLLLDHGFSAVAVDRRGHTPLHTLCAAATTPLGTPQTATAARARAAAARKLLRHGSVAAAVVVRGDVLADAGEHGVGDGREAPLHACARLSRDGGEAICFAEAPAMGGSARAFGSLAGVLGSWALLAQPNVVRSLRARVDALEDLRARRQDLDTPLQLAARSAQPALVEALLGEAVSCRAAARGWALAPDPAESGALGCGARVQCSAAAGTSAEPAPDSAPSAPAVASPAQHRMSQSMLPRILPLPVSAEPFNPGVEWRNGLGLCPRDEALRAGALECVRIIDDAPDSPGSSG